MLNEQADIFCPLTRKSHDTTAGIPKFDRHPLIKPHGNAKSLIAVTL